MSVPLHDDDDDDGGFAVGCIGLLLALAVLGAASLLGAAAGVAHAVYRLIGGDS